MTKTKTKPDQESAAMAVLVLWLVGAGFIAGLALSPKLWTSAGRVFPQVPVFGWLGDWPVALQIALYAALLVCVGLLMWRPSQRGAVAGIVGLWLVLVAQDQMRLQPWTYQYVLMLVPFFWFGGKGERAGAVLWLACVVMVGIYFWSGIHKFGPQFTALYESELIGPWLPTGEGFVRSALLFGGRMIPWTEVLLAVLLVFPRTRRLGVLLAWGMHLLILLWLGPLGKSINSVIWPWNAVMMVLVAVLFWNDRRPLLSLAVFGSAPKGLQRAAWGVLLLVVVMPLFSLSGEWDRYLSFHLYSGDQQRVMLVLEPSGVEKLGDRYAPFLIKERYYQGMSELEFMPWALRELNVPFVSEDRIAYGIAKKLVETAGLTDGDGFFYRDFPKMVDRFQVEEIKPSEIEAMGAFAPLRPAVRPR